MASKQPFKLINVQAMAKKLWLNANYFAKYYLFFQKKHILVIGDQQSQLYKHFTSKISSGWKIQTLQPKQLAYPKTYHHNQTQYYQQVEARVGNKQYQSIVVLPSNDIPDFGLQDEDFATHFPEVYLNLLIVNLFAYKIASKHLSPTGLMILSCNEKEFLNMKPFQHEQYGRGRQKPDEVKQNKRQYGAAKCLADGATAYLGVILGERYDISLNSNTIIALTNQLSREEPQEIAKFYLRWVNNKGLPSPGSFARFQPPNEKASTYYVEYL